MREKDNGEKLLDMLASMSLSYDAADDAYQLAGEVVYELDDVKEENIALKKRIADLEAHVHHLRDSAQMVPVSREALETLRLLVYEIDCLVDESDGVYGLHMNGDPSPWGEILPGGRFERLCSLEAARSLLDEP